MTHATFSEMRHCRKTCDPDAVDDLAPAGPDLVTLFYRADWTSLALTARVHGRVDFAAAARQALAENLLRPPPPLAPPEALGVRSFAGTLTLEPGGHFTADISEPAELAAEDPLHWMRLRREGFCSQDGDAPETPPYPQLLCPARLLSGFTLQLSAEIGAAAGTGRRALAVTALPVPGALATRRARPDRIEVIADAATGILLRSEEILDGQTLRLAELTEVAFGEPGAPFRPEEDAAARERRSEAFARFMSGPGWTTARQAANVAGTVLGPVIRHAPRRQDAGGPDPDAAMPPGDSGTGPAAGGAGVPDALVHALHRATQAEFAGDLHSWTDVQAAARQGQATAAEHGWSGLGAAVGAVGDRTGVIHQVRRVRTGRGGRYRVEWIRSRNTEPDLACDGTQLMREYPAKVVLCPAIPLPEVIASLVSPSALLECQLTGVRATTSGGRPAFAARVGRVSDSWGGLKTREGAELVIDAELGIVLAMVWRAGGQPAVRHEFRNVTAGPGDDAVFRPPLPPGVRVVRTGSGLLDQATAALPEPARLAVKAAEGGIRAARGLLGQWNARRGQ